MFNIIDIMLFISVSSSKFAATLSFYPFILTARSAVPVGVDGSFQLVFCFMFLHFIPRY